MTSRIVVRALTLSADGFGAGPGQSLQQPLGEGGMDLHQWLLPTRTFQQQVLHQEGGTAGVDDDYAAASFAGVGAWIMGRNMFGPVRGPWPDDSWRGWWGDEPPYHVPVFVLTHHARADLVMQGGTSFHFVTGGLQEAVARAREAAGGQDIRIGGGVSTVRQALLAGLVDEMHLVISPMLLGQGESLLAGVDLKALGFRVVKSEGTAKGLHLLLAR